MSTAASSVIRGLRRDSGAATTLEPVGQCTICRGCGQSIDPQSHGLDLREVPCHVRAFRGRRFWVWRCPNCKGLQCLDVVDLDRYYAQYPFVSARITWPFRQFYRNLERRLVQHGLTPAARLLDYGCGNGLFVKSLRRHGYIHSAGYDPYASTESWGNRGVLEAAGFDWIVLQDVIEHVANPLALLAEINGYLRPGGRVLVGTPNAERVNLERPEQFLNELHVPYHLHIFTRSMLEAAGREQGWFPIAFYDRAYHDLPWPGLNSRAAKAYQCLCDGTLDAAFEPLRVARLFVAPRFWYWALLGYWLSDRADMTVIFQKPATAA